MQIAAIAMLFNLLNPIKRVQLPLLLLTVGLGAAVMYLRRNQFPISKEDLDDKLEGLVRREFQRKIHHAKSLQIDVHDGVVTVSGPILLDEVDTLIASIRAVPGVKRVEDHLQAHPADTKTYMN